MTSMREFDLDPYGSRWRWRISPFTYIGGTILCFFVVIADYREGGLSMSSIGPLLMIPVFTHHAWWWWRYERKPPYIKIWDNSIEFRRFGTTDVEKVELGQILRVTLAGGNAIFNLPDESQIQIPYTRRTFESTQEAKSKLKSWAKTHGIEVVG